MSAPNQEWAPAIKEIARFPKHGARPANAVSRSESKPVIITVDCCQFADEFAHGFIVNDKEEDRKTADLAARNCNSILFWLSPEQFREKERDIRVRLVVYHGISEIQAFLRLILKSGNHGDR
jgi:hypothetical protein